MISDIMSEAIESIDYYLSEPAFKDVYTGDLRERILKVRKEMQDIQTELDTPPVNPDFIQHSSTQGTSNDK